MPSRFFAALVALLALGLAPLGGHVAALAQSTTATVSGTARDSQGNALPGVTITLTGAGNYAATTDSDGKYTLSVKPGIYSIRASRPGYNEATQDNYAVLPGTPNNLDVTMVERTVSSLQEIGRIRVTSANSTFNTTPASVTIIPNAAFQEQGQLTLARVLEEQPGFTASYPTFSGNLAARGAYSVSQIRLGFTTETSTLVDGHPVGNGDNGSTIIFYFEPDTFGSVELIKGPGANAPEINNAINGVVNFRTLEPTSRPRASVRYGIDGFGGQSANFRATGTLLKGKLGYAFDYVVDGTQGPLRQLAMPSTIPGTALINGQVQTAVTFSPPVNSANNGIQNNTLWSSATLLHCCFLESTQYLNRAELAKLRWNFSPNTAVTASLLDEQLFAAGNGLYNTSFPVFFAPGASYPSVVTGQFNSGTFVNTVEQLSAAPSVPGQVLNRIQPIYQLEFRTGNSSDSFIGRYYRSLFDFFVTQNGSFAPPDQPATTALSLYGTVSLCPVGYTFTTPNCVKAGSPNVAPTVNTFTGQQANITYVAANGVCPGATPGTYIGASTPVGANGNTCGTAANPFSNYVSPPWYYGAQFDRLRGGTIEYDHFFHNGTALTLSYDTTHHDGNLPGLFGPPIVPAVPPGAFLENTTILARGIFNFDKLNVTLSNYLNRYRAHYSNNAGIPVPVPNVTAGTVANGAFSVFNSNLTFQDKYTTFDAPRLGMTYRATQDLSLRLSAGESVVPVFLSALNVSNTLPTCNGVTSICTNTLANNNLVPETAFGVDFGYDWRVGDRATVISMDLYRTNLQNQIFTQTINNCYTAATGAIAVSPTGVCTAPAQTLYTTQNTNLAVSRYEGFEFSFKRDTPVGPGFTLQGALMRGYPYNISPCFYLTAPGPNCTGTPTTNLGILPYVNFQPLGSVGSPGAVAAPAPGGVLGSGFPYAQGYFELHWRSPRGGLMQFTSQYFGNNNGLNVPAFVLMGANAVLPLWDSNTKVIANVYNLNNQWSSSLPGVYQGVTFPVANNKIGLANAASLGPRRLSVAIQHDFTFGK